MKVYGTIDRKRGTNFHRVCDLKESIFMKNNSSIILLTIHRNFHTIPRIPTTVDATPTVPELQCDPCL